MTTEGVQKHKKYLLLYLAERGNLWAIEDEFDTLSEYVERLKQGNFYGEIMLVEYLTWHVVIEGKEEE